MGQGQAWPRPEEPKGTKHSPLTPSELHQGPMLPGGVALSEKGLEKERERGRGFVSGPWTLGHSGDMLVPDTCPWVPQCLHFEGSKGTASFMLWVVFLWK